MIYNRLLQKTRYALEHEVLSGDGSVSDRTGKPGIVGLLNTTGLPVVPYVAGKLPPDAVLDAIVNLLQVGATPNVIAMNPLDYGDLLKTKATGSGEYVASPFVTLAQTVWGVTITPAAGVPAGQLLVGDTTTLQLMVREPAQVLVSDSDQDDFLRNRVALLCEGRWALAVWQPTAFVSVHTARY